MARNSTNLSGILSGVSGEYFVAAELSRMGYIASITLRNTKGVDILASNADASRTVAIQVKTSRDRRKWLLNSKAEDYYADNLFYVLVNLNNGGPPDYFVVPSADAARMVSEQFQEWYAKRGRKPPTDNTMRDLRIANDADYLGRWDLLGLDGDQRRLVA